MVNGLKYENSYISKKAIANESHILCCSRFYGRILMKAFQIRTLYCCNIISEVVKINNSAICLKLESAKCRFSQSCCCHIDDVAEHAKVDLSCLSQEKEWRKFIAPLKRGEAACTEVQYFLQFLSIPHLHLRPHYGV